MPNHPPKNVESKKCIYSTRLSLMALLSFSFRISYTLTRFVLHNSNSPMLYSMRCRRLYSTQLHSIRVASRYTNAVASEMYCWKDFFPMPKFLFCYWNFIFFGKDFRLPLILVAYGNGKYVECKLMVVFIPQSSGNVK